MMIILFRSGFWSSVYGVLYLCVSVRQLYENSDSTSCDGNRALQACWSTCLALPSCAYADAFAHKVVLENCYSPFLMLVDLLVITLLSQSTDLLCSPGVLTFCPFLLLRCKLHAIKFTILKYNSVVLVCGQDYATITVNSRTSLSPQKETCMH